MKKKNHLFLMALTAVTALGITSCADLYDDALGFSTSMDNSIQVNAMIGSGAMTKAAATLPASSETTTDALKADGGGFNLFAWQGTATGSPTITATKFKWSTTDSKFVEDGTAGTYYWPEGLVKFWAYAVDNKSVASGDLPTLSSASGTDQFTKDYTVSATAQDDPVFAYTAQNKHDDDNYVNLTFQHLLSRVSINAYAPHFTNGYVRLLSFGFTSVSTGGTFTYTPTNETAISTSDAFAASCWGTFTSGNIGAVTTGDDPATWYTSMSGVPVSDGAIQFTAGTGPVVPSESTGTTTRLSYAPTSGDAVTVPWLNVVPGGEGGSSATVAKTLVVTYQYYNPNTSAWITKNASVDITAGSVPAKTDGGTTDIYNPGYQYIYNVRILGQETDDAEVKKAEILIDGVTVTPWSDQSISEVKTEDAGSGSNLKKLIESADAFSTVTLKKDVDLTDAGTINVTKSMTIDLAGYTIKAPASGVIFNISSEAKVVIKGGTLDASSVEGDFSYDDGTKATINAGGVIVVRDGAELIIEQSTSTEPATTTTITLENAKASCIYVAGATTKVTVNAGIFSNGATGGETVKLASDANKDNVVISGSTMVADYEALIAAVADETTSSVIISKDIDVTSTIVISKDFTIDLNGHNIAATSRRAIQQKKGTLTLTGTGTVKADGTTPFAKSGTGYVDASGNFKRASSVIRIGDNTLTDAAGIVVGANVTVSSNFCMGISYFGKGAQTVEINGTVTSACASALSGSGSTGLGATAVTINDGATITSSGTKSGDDDHTAAGIYHPEAGTLTINGGTITGATGIYVKSGTVNTAINAGTITGNGAKVTYVSSNDGFTPTGDAIVFDNCNYPGGAPNAAINGGTFISTNASAVASYAASEYDAITGFINGGTFSDLNAAKYAAQGATIKLNGNIESLAQRFELTANQTYTIDLNGYTITSTKSCGNGSAIDVKAGTVTIQNGTITSNAGDVQNDTTEVDAITVRSGATVNLNTLTVTVNSKNGCCAYAFDGGHINIASGTYTNSTAVAYQYRSSWQGLVLNQANVNTKLVEITAGTFKGQNPADGDDSWNDDIKTANNGFIKSDSTASYDSETRTCTVTAAQNE